MKFAGCIFLMLILVSPASGTVIHGRGVVTVGAAAPASWVDPHAGDLAAHWNGQETNAAGIVDVTGKGWDLQVFPNWATGIQRHIEATNQNNEEIIVWIYDGSDDYLNTVSNFPPSSGAQTNTICIWLYPENFEGDDGSHLKPTWWSYGNVYQSFKLFHVGATPGPTNGVTGYHYYDGDPQFWSGGNILVPSNQWTHITYTTESTGSVVYINGQYDFTDTDTFMDQVGGNQIMQINGQNGANWLIPGRIGDIRIYTNRILTLEEIVNTASNTVPALNVPGMNPGGNIEI